MKTDAKTRCPVAPPKPSDVALWLYGATITKITLKHLWTTDDGTDSKTILTLYDEAKEEFATTEDLYAAAIVDFSPDYRSLCRLKEDAKAACRAWLEFSKSHADKIAQFEKLKSELGL